MSVESIEIVRKPAAKSREEFLNELAEQGLNACRRALDSGKVTRAALEAELEVSAKAKDDTDVISGITHGSIAGRHPASSKYEQELAKILREAERSK